MIIYNLLFIPLTITIPIVYGSAYNAAATFAALYLIIKIPMIIKRSAISYLLSIKKRFTVAIINLLEIALFLFLSSVIDISISNAFWPIPLFLTNIVGLVLFGIALRGNIYKN